MIRWSRLIAGTATVAIAAVLVAAPPPPQKNTPTNAGVVKPSSGIKPVANVPVSALTPPVHPDRPGVHIDWVHIQSNCGTATTYVVEVRNNLTKVAQHGMVLLTAANHSQNHMNFDNLRPGEVRTLTIATPWGLTCELSETGDAACIEATISMEPDLTANGEVWDNVAHTVCSNPPRTGTNTPVVTDTQHKIPL